MQSNDAKYIPLLYFARKRKSKSGLDKILNVDEVPVRSSIKTPLLLQCKSCVDPMQLAFTFHARRRTIESHAQRYRPTNTQLKM